jgi:signal transduction histidine kinase/HAMP domain-containing protein
MKLRLKITLALLGVVASMGSLGFLGVKNLFDSRAAQADLQQLSERRFLAQQVRGALDHVLVLVQHVDASSGTEEREEFHARADRLLKDLAQLASFAANSGAQDRVLALESEVAALKGDYERASSGPSAEADEAIRSIATGVSRIRRHERQLRTLLEDGFLLLIVSANRQLQWSHFWLYTSLLVAVLLALGFGYLLHRMILDPIAELRNGIERIRTGDLDVSLESEGHDELSQVTGAFVEMSESLQRQFEEEERLIQGLDEANERLQQERHDFEQLVEIGKSSSSTLEFHEVLGVLTTRADGLISCLRCSIFRLDEAYAGTASILSSTHYPSSGPARVTIDDYPEVCLAIERHETIQIDDVATDERMVDAAEATLGAGIASVLTVPMILRGRLLGAISFMRSSEDGGFTPWERCVAESIAGIGAVCMENADLYGAMRKSRDDVEALNVTLRETVEELRSTRDRLVASEKLAAVGGVSASIAHSLKNPLAAIRAMAQAEIETGPEGENLQDIIMMVDRLGAHMNQILDFCRTGNEIRSSVDPNRIIASVVEMLHTQAGERGVMVVSNLDSNLPALSANPERFERAVLSVIENAVEACEPGKNVEIVTEREGTSGIRIEVRDEGPGVPEETLSHMFEPFFSTKASGTGLGTTIARTVVESLDGSVDVRCDPQGGTRFLMRIPGIGG